MSVEFWKSQSLGKWHEKEAANKCRNVHFVFADKLVVKDGQEWCMDVFDQFVLAGQSVTVGEAVIRRYRPVSSDNDHIVLHIFSSERDDCQVSLIFTPFCRYINS